MNNVVDVSTPENLALEQYSSVVDAIRQLALNCDGAHVKDGAGFNAYDSDYGKRLAEISNERDLTYPEQMRATKIAHKYRRQIGWEFPTPSEYIGINKPAQAPDADFLTMKLGKIENEDVVLVYMPTWKLRNQYMDKVKQIPGRAWRKEMDGSPWSIPLQQRDELLKSLGNSDDILIPEEVKTAVYQKYKHTVRVTKIGTRLAVKFSRSDPDFYAHLGNVKQIPGRQYDKENTQWTVPLGRAGDVQRAFPNAKGIKELVEESLARAEELQELANMSKVSHSDFKVPGMDMLYPYQRAGVEFFVKANGRALCGDEMGLGKSIESLAYLQLYPEKRPAFIICPASLKLNWFIECRKWMTTDDRYIILSGRKPFGLDLSGGTTFIINYDIIQAWAPIIIKTIKDARKKGLSPVVIADEAQYLKSGNKTQRGKAFFSIAKQVDHLIFLTGTPIVNRPIELYPLLHALSPVEWPTKAEFSRRYCDARNNGFGMDNSGASNLEELHAKLGPFMIRRLKADVLQDLPAKRRITIPVQLGKKHKAEYETAIQVAREKLRREGSAMEHLVIIEVAKQAAAAGKLAAIIEWIDSYLEQNKLVVFCTHNAIVNALMEKYGDIAVKVTGAVTGKKRQENVERFQSDDSVRLFVGNLKAAGTGLTLTAASATAHLELDWSPALHEQGESRVHRIGQKSESVEAYYFIAVDTIEEDIMHLLEAKREIIDQVVDGVELVDQHFNVLSELVKIITA